MDSEGGRTEARRSAEEICADVELSDEARQLLREDHTGRRFIEELRREELYFEAIKVLARCMPKPRAVTWGLECVRSEASGDDPTCLVAAEQWLAHPGDTTRAAALEAAEANNFETPSAWVAAAAGWTGGSLASDGLPEVPPGDHLTAWAVASAVGVVASRDPETFKQRQHELLKRGLELWSGADRQSPR